MRRLPLLKCLEGLSKARKEYLLKKRILLLLGSLLVSATLCSAASAQTCAAYPYSFANGSTADATQVNADFNAIRTCANTLLAPLAGPQFTGASTFHGTLTDTVAGDTQNLVGTTATLSPPTASGTNFRAFIMSLTYDTSSNFTANGVNTSTGGWFENRIVNSGTISESAAAEFWGLWAGSNAASLGTVALVQAAKFTPVQSFSNSLTSTITQSVGVHISDSAKNTFALVGQAGIRVDPLAAATNNTALLIGQTTVPTGNFAIYDAATSNNYLAGKLGIGTSSPAQALEVNGEAKIDTFGSATALPVCQLSGVLSSCSSSLRYKENVQSATFGLKEVDEMRPVTFKWKGRDEADLGLIAEEVSKINPLFVTTKNGQVEGVKYAQLTAVLINAVKSLKAESDQQAKRISELQAQVSNLQHASRLRTAMRSHTLEASAINR